MARATLILAAWGHIVEIPTALRRSVRIVTELQFFEVFEGTVGRIIVVSFGTKPGVTARQIEGGRQLIARHPVWLLAGQPPIDVE
ncbi:hypothetical protein BTO20_36250 [Mycobacterium dioxanotrophicus]|uniref:Uncharacterized protein n=1 Tax=Mycobacterium dioxanotrophicus TaxID=482462 RepID=A0A1Y0CDC4_9MYCO|nr:hypothetical protein BTO20_36250 [Mycobacterium dioxanotrophicus]